MKKYNEKLIFAYAITSILCLLGIWLQWPNFLMAVLTPLPVVILGIWFVRFTANHNNSWTRLAMTGSILFCVIGDTLLPWTKGEIFDPSLMGVAIRGVYLASYALIAAAFLAKTPFSNGYVRKSPLLVFLSLAHHAGMLFLVLQLTAPANHFETWLYGIFLSSVYFAALNVRSTENEMAWRWAFLGLYLLFLSEVCSALLGSFNILSNLLYLLGQFQIVAATGHMVRRERY